MYLHSAIIVLIVHENTTVDRVAGEIKANGNANGALSVGVYLHSAIIVLIVP